MQKEAFKEVINQKFRNRFRKLPILDILAKLVAPFRKKIRQI